MRLKGLYEWWSRTSLPSMMAGEIVIGDTPAHRHGARFWESKRGRLVLTNQRLIFLPTLARLLPAVPFAGSKVMLRKDDVVSAEFGRSHWRQVLKMAPSSSFVTLTLRDGKMMTFYSPITRDVQSWAGH